MAWLDRFLLGFARETVDWVAMGLTAAAVLFVALVLLAIVIAAGRVRPPTRTSEMPREGLGTARTGAPGTCRGGVAAG